LDNTVLFSTHNPGPFSPKPLIWWDNLKYQIKRYSKLFSSNLAKEKRKDFFYIQNKIQRLCDAQARGIVITLGDKDLLIKK
jgi:hypothetical protein